MSTEAEKIRAQGMAFRDCATQPWHRHIIGAVELEMLFGADKENRHCGMILATLCDMVLGEDAEDRSDEALLRGVMRLLDNAEVSDVCPPLTSETEKPRTGTRSLH